MILLLIFYVINTTPSVTWSLDLHLTVFSRQLASTFYRVSEAPQVHAYYLTLDPCCLYLILACRVYSWHLKWGTMAFCCLLGHRWVVYRALDGCRSSAFRRNHSIPYKNLGYWSRRLIRFVQYSRWNSLWVLSPTLWDHQYWVRPWCYFCDRCIPLGRASYGDKYRWGYSGKYRKG